MATHISKPLLRAVVSSAFFLKSLAVGREGQVTYSKTWLWSLALETLVGQGFGAKTLVKIILFLVKDPRSGYPFTVWWRQGEEKEQLPTDRAPLSQAISPSLASPWFVWWLFPEQSLPQH